MSQNVSLLIDGQLDGDDAARLLNELGADGALRDRLTLYVLAGDAMRGVNVLDDGFSKRIFERLRGEGVKVEQGYDPLA